MGMGSVSSESRIFHKNNENWFYYCQFICWYHLDEEAAACPLDFSLPISVVPVVNSFTIEGQARAFVLLPSNQYPIKF